MRIFQQIAAYQIHIPRSLGKPQLSGGLPIEGWTINNMLNN